MRATTLCALCLLLALGTGACKTDSASRGDRDATTDAGITSATSALADTVGAIADSTSAVPANTTTGAAGTAGDALGDAVARVNGAPIPLADFQRQVFDTQRFYVEQGLDPKIEDRDARYAAFWEARRRAGPVARMQLVTDTLWRLFGRNEGAVALARNSGMSVLNKLGPVKSALIHEAFFN